MKRKKLLLQYEMPNPVKRKTLKILLLGWKPDKQLTKSNGIRIAKLSNKNRYLFLNKSPTQSIFTV